MNHEGVGECFAIFPINNSVREDKTGPFALVGAEFDRRQGCALLDIMNRVVIDGFRAP